MPHFRPSPAGALIGIGGFPKTGAMAYTVVLEGGTPWGFRLQGGREFNEPIRVGKINPNSKAYNQGIKVGEYVESIQGQQTQGLMHNEALQLIRNANNRLSLQLTKEPPGVIPEIRVNGPVNGDFNDNIIKLNGSAGFIKTNATSTNNNHSVNCDSEDMSGSTSDSQSSIIHVMGPSNGGPSDPSDLSPSAKMNKPTSAVWSPYGISKVKTYKPVSFSSSAGGGYRPVSAPPNQGPSPQPQQSSFNNSFNLNKVPWSSPSKPTSTFSTSPQSSSWSPPTSRQQQPPPQQQQQQQPVQHPTQQQQFQNGHMGQGSSSGGASENLPQHNGNLSFNGGTNSGSIGGGGGIGGGSPSGSYSKPQEITVNSITSSTKIKLQEPADAAPQATSSSPRKITQSPVPKSVSASWTPGGRVTPSIDELLDERRREREESLSRETPTLWSPDETTDSPVQKFRPIKLETKSLRAPESSGHQGHQRPLTPEESFAWKPPERTTTAHITATTTTTTTSTMSLPASPTTSFSSWNGTISHFAETKSGLPLSQSPTITLLQKSREGKIPKGAIYMGTKELQEGDKTHQDSYYLVPGETKKTVTKTEKKAPKFEGVGPTDTKTGMPLGLRASIDEKSQKDWYKKIYSSLHKTDKKEGDKPRTSSQSGAVNNYRPTYVFPDFESESEKEDANPYRQSYEFPDETRSSTMSLDRYGLHSLRSKDRKYTWSPPSAKYREEKYKNQPLSIKDYEPGYSSLAFREARINNQYNPPIEKPGQYSRYVESDSEVDFLKRERATSQESDASSHDAYLVMQKGGDIPMAGLRYPLPSKRDRAYSQSPTPLRSISISSSRSPSATLDRRRRDEDAAKRKEELKRITSEERRRRWEEEMKTNQARRHTDNFIAKSPIQLDRFEEAASLPRPKKKSGTKIRGKAKAMYSFRAQNPRELSFKKHDIIYLLRQLDRNWYEGEKHGLVGIFPCNYVEVLTSLDEARQAAFTREGLARAKYNFRPQTAMELKLTKGDTVYLIRKVDSNWVEGRVGHEQGIFPASYVDIVTEPDTPLMTPMSSYAPTPATGSPGQLSPVSTISNGPAPTIPSAPISPRGFDDFDFNQPMTSYGSLPAHQLHPSYHSDFTRGSSQSSRSPSSPYGSLDRPRAHSAQNGHRSSSSNKDMFKEQRDMLFTDLLHSPPKDPRSEPKGRISPNPYGGTELMGIPIPSSTRGRSSPGYGTSSKNVMSKSFEEPRYPTYRAVFTYMPQNEDELELKEGDTVRVMEKCDDGWFVGTSERTKEFGTFPGNYVQPV